MDRLHRTRLLLGDGAIDKLKSSTIMIVGCGAVGSFAIEAIARSGIGHIVLIDFDNIEPTNINRQLFALDSTLGLPKVSVAATRIHDINPDIRVTVINTFFDENTTLDITPDFVIDAIDSTTSKIALYNWCVAHNVPFISSMGAALKTDPTQIKISKISRTSVCPLASKIRKMSRELKLPDFPVVFSSQPPQTPAVGGKTLGSLVTVTGIFGLLLANYAIDSLLGK
ncbi:MAG: tRNA threonylcarbamoyladenosine dehydratase [Alphaproteobacteria bacterium]|nr:tRNA threonylcarbamoyladenosine dehydratase [Alphaproteobacteria bacterium]